jgi:pyruvate,water dikinase
MGFTNVKIMIPFCRTVAEGQRVLKVMESEGLKRGRNGLQVYVMVEIPSNVILAKEFADLFDGFSIGSNDLTQLTLGVDRDSSIISHIYDERNEAVKRLVAAVIASAKKTGTKIGICGDAPSTFPDFARFLVEAGIDTISLSPDAVFKTTLQILEEERKMARRGSRRGRRRRH